MNKILIVIVNMDKGVMQCQPQGKWRVIAEFNPVLGKFNEIVEDNIATHTLSDLVKESEKIIRSC